MTWRYSLARGTADYLHSRAGGEALTAYMTGFERTKSAETTALETIEELLRRRGASGLEVRPGSRIRADLGFDSLELAELSAVLEDELGRDPYSEGIVPDTVAELLNFYKPG
jgi:acyl carrier protein